MGGFSAPSFVFLEGDFPTTKNNSDRIKFRGGVVPASPPPGTTPLLCTVGSPQASDYIVVIDRPSTHWLAEWLANEQRRQTSSDNRPRGKLLHTQTQGLENLFEKPSFGRFLEISHLKRSHIFRFLLVAQFFNSDHTWFSIIIVIFGFWRHVNTQAPWTIFWLGVKSTRTLLTSFLWVPTSTTLNQRRRNDFNIAGANILWE